jgi:hypothetical protein
MLRGGNVARTSSALRPDRMMCSAWPEPPADRPMRYAAVGRYPVNRPPSSSQRTKLIEQRPARGHARGVCISFRHSLSFSPRLGGWGQVVSAKFPRPPPIRSRAIFSPLLVVLCRLCGQPAGKTKVQQSRGDMAFQGDSRANRSIKT